VKAEPFRLEPVLHPRLWGPRTLAPLFPALHDLPEPIGETWLSETACRAAGGPYAGAVLGEAWKAMPVTWRGERLAQRESFPLLTKFLFPVQKLSIQVHPDDAYAAKHEVAAGGCGKTEVWHIVSAKPGARLLLGLKSGVTREQFLAGLAAHTLEDLLQSHPVQAGDTFFIAPGTVHTLGADMVVCEVQQYSDLTYRVYDYGRTDAQGRPRALHIDKALDVIHFGEQRIAAMPSLPLRDADGNSGRLLAACRHFAAERWEIQREARFAGTPDAFRLLIFLAGSGELRWNAGSSAYHPGECWFIPANLAGFALAPQESSSAIVTWIPDTLQLGRKLAAGGASEKEIAQVVLG